MQMSRRSNVLSLCRLADPVERLCPRVLKANNNFVKDTAITGTVMMILNHSVLVIAYIVAHPTYFNSKHGMHAHTNVRLYVSTHPVAKISCDARNIHIKHGGTYNHIGILFIPQFAIFGQWQPIEER